MKKHLLLLTVMVIASVTLFGQVSKGDIELFQKYFGVEKAAMVKDYMQLTPKQDSAFWPVYNKYETERMALGQQRIALVDEYLKNSKNLAPEKATSIVEKGVDLEIKFKNLQKKYFTQMNKVIGPVKAAQFYQMENYINNAINISIQENIPFVGELEQKHENKMKK